MLTVASSLLKQFACCLLTKSSIQKTSSCFVATMSVPQSIVSMDFMMNAKEGNLLL
nr:unnamed protein product [Callosobruchus analis]